MRYFMALAICVLLCAGLCGCSQKQDGVIVLHNGDGQEGEGGEEEAVKISFFGFKAESLNLVAIETALHGFMEENESITVTYEGVKGQPYWDAFEKRLETGEMDDVMMLDHDRIISMGAQGKLVDLSDLDTIGRFNDMAKGQFTNEDGSIYFLPTCISTYGMYINYDLLKEHGQEVPGNLAEFMEVCDYFVGQGIVPVIANNYSSLRSLIVAKGLYPIYQKEDAVDEIKKYNHGEKELVQVLYAGIEMVEMMIGRGWLDCEEVLATEQTSDDLELFVEGKRPFMVTGGWASPRVMAKEPGFTYGVHPFPVLEDGSVLVMDVNTCIGINADSEHVEETKKFVSYLTQPDVMWEYCDSQSSFTPLQDERMPNDETLLPSAEYLSNGRTVIGTDYNITLPLDTSLRECGTQMLNGMDAQAAAGLLEDLLKEGGS